MPYARPLYDFNEIMDLDPKNYKAWILGSSWYPPPMCPLFVDLHYCYGKYGMQFGPERISDPYTRGWDWRVYNGAFILTVIQTTEEERKKREPIYREKMREILQDPWKEWLDYKVNLKPHFEEFFAIDLTKLSDIELCSHFMETWHYDKYVQEAHFAAMYSLGAANISFRRFLKEVLNINVYDVEYSQLHSGFENEYTNVVNYLAELAASALDLGLQEVFKDSKVEEIISKLKDSENGAKWVSQFEEIIKKYGYMRRRGLEVNTPTWWEDNTIPLIDIKRYVEEGKRVAITKDMTAELAKKRKELEKELSEKVDPSYRDAFLQLMNASQASQVFSEEHTLYVEMMGHTAIRIVALECGRRFASMGMIDSHEDVLYLHHDEIIHAMIIQQRCDLRKLVNERKEEYSELRKYEGTIPFVIGDPEGLVDLSNADAVFAVSGAPPIAKPEEVGASLVGCAGSPGVVEGIVRVVKGEEELDDVEPGEILVAPATAASCTMVFNSIVGVITDGGGYLSHALIVAREFGMPAVVGTQEATKK
ncbi:MAG: PEP-utilizing enzyme, partial [Desulfotomaculaceae bacterium]|nr:PEP-utilizing enzyme [Desulfotomaculaceae bacterium]